MIKAVCEINHNSLNTNILGLFFREGKRQHPAGVTGVNGASPCLPPSVPPGEAISYTASPHQIQHDTPSCQAKGFMLHNECSKNKSTPMKRQRGPSQQACFSHLTGQPGIHPPFLSLTEADCGLSQSARPSKRTPLRESSDQGGDSTVRPWPQWRLSLGTQLSRLQGDRQSRSP